ncbi:MAG TPA: LysM peptidoglycan-binding domain-containing protein [Kofleriaceae bacterium]|jgi:LysM repeat protein|nr:LysM peptidoglycan-binding domain-containing protein [Kofleriaceae bacterium]
MRLAVALLVITWLRVAHAQDATNNTRLYRVKQGDSLELIAAEFYSDRTKAVFIMVENKMTHARPLKPGERLRIPVSREITTSPGDTFESLASNYLGNARRASFLADFNGISQDDSLPAGTPITIPFTITHTAAATESLSDIAKAYFGDGKNADLLRRYNFLEKTSLDRNESLIVPVYHVRLSAAKMSALDPEAKARREHRREASARAAKALPAARQAWKDGDFAGVKGALAQLDPDLDYLDINDAVEIGVLLGAAHVAYDDAELALASFKRVVDRQSQHVLDRYEYSPKILEIWQKAGGKVE